MGRRKSSEGKDTSRKKKKILMWLTVLFWEDLKNGNIEEEEGKKVCKEE